MKKYFTEKYINPLMNAIIFMACILSCIFATIIILIIVSLYINPNLDLLLQFKVAYFGLMCSSLTICVIFTIYAFYFIYLTIKSLKNEN